MCTWYVSSWEAGSARWLITSWVCRICPGLLLLLLLLYAPTVVEKAKLCKVFAP